MTVQDIQDQIKQLDDADFQQLKSWVVTVEENRRAAQPEIEQAKQEAEAETATKITQQLAEEHPELVEKPTVQTGSEVREWETWHPLKESTHYRYGDLTRHGGKVWRDVLDPTGETLNVWEPGAPGIDERYWVEDEPETMESEETEETSTEQPAEQPAEQPTAPAYRQPTGAHDAYKQGDRVTYKGAIYESTINANVWAPDAYPAGWKKLA